MVSEIGCLSARDIMPHSCGQVPVTRQLFTGQPDILEHETTKYTRLQMICCAYIKYLLVMGNQYFWWASKILRSWLHRDNHTTFGFQKSCIHCMYTGRSAMQAKLFKYFKFSHCSSCTECAQHQFQKALGQRITVSFGKSSMKNLQNTTEIAFFTRPITVGCFFQHLWDSFKGPLSIKKPRP
jgi:hypothetical protein